MIRRLYVDNFRCLDDFTWNPQVETLVVGVNGSGKSAAVDALELIRSWAADWSRIEDVLRLRDLTRWRHDEIVRFELDFKIGGSIFEYRVQFDCRTDRTPRAVEEILGKDGADLFRRGRDAASLKNDESESEAQIPIPSNLSALGVLSNLSEARELARVLDYLKGMVITRPLPRLMGGETQSPAPTPTALFENFVAWYWDRLGNSQFAAEISKLLSGVWAGFGHLKLERVGRDTRALSLVFEHQNGSTGRIELDFAELSDGERMLVALYGIAAYQRVEAPTTIIVDEPDNFLALAELQPWLLEMTDSRPDDGQFILISHNAELIQTMGEKRIDYFEREDHFSGPKLKRTRLERGGVSLAERIARGWVKTEDAAEGRLGA